MHVVNNGFPCSSICSAMAERNKGPDRGQNTGKEENNEQSGLWQCLKCDFSGDKDAAIHHHLN